MMHGSGVPARIDALAGIGLITENAMKFAVLMGVVLDRPTVLQNINSSRLLPLDVNIALRL